MDNAKLKILKMLEEGKITAEEAARLMDAGASGKSGAGGASSSADEPNKSNGPPPGRGAGPGLDDFTRDLGRKFETLAKDFEPKFQKFTEIVVEKTAGMTDKLAQTMERPRSAATGQTTAGTRTGTGGTKDFEITVAPGYNELHLAGFNGDVIVKGYNGNKISLRVTAKANRPGAEMSLSQLGGKYTLVYDENAFQTVSLDAFVPSNMFNFMVIRTVNGKLSVADVAAKNACFDNMNGPVTASNADVENMKLISENGDISIIMNTFNSFSDYTWAVETSNGKLNMHLPSAPDFGYHMRAHATLGSIQIGLVGLNYLSSDPSNVEARSLSFDTASRRVKMSLETSNAPISVS